MSPPPAPIVLVPIPDTQVEPGPSRLGGDTGAFKVRRDEGDAGKTFLEAAASCIEHGRMLCTDTQWLRACDAHPEIGKMPSWTATWKNGKAIVRGGVGCDRREKVDGVDRSPTRVGLCCERAVGARGEGDAGDWIERAPALVLQWENALNHHDADAQRAMLGGKVVRDGRMIDRAKLIAKEQEALKSDPVLWTLFDGCSVRTGPVVVDVDADAGRTGRLQGILVDCLMVVAQRSGVVSMRTKLGLATTEGEEHAEIHEIEHRGSRVPPGAR